MSIVSNFEWHKESFNIFSLIFDNAVTLAFLFNIDRVLEESSWLSVFKHWSQKCTVTWMRFKNRIRESTLLSLYKLQIQWIVLQVLVDFGLYLVLKWQTRLMRNIVFGQVFLKWLFILILLLIRVFWFLFLFVSCVCSRVWKNWPLNWWWDRFTIVKFSSFVCAQIHSFLRRASTLLSII